MVLPNDSASGVSPMPVVSARGVHKTLGKTEVLKGIDLDVQAGKTVVFMGGSGSGKTTLLRCINHLATIDRGRLLVDGDPVGYAERDGKLFELRGAEIARRRAKIGMVFQHFNLFPHLTVLENVTLAPRKVKGLTAKEAEELAAGLLTRVKLGDKLGSYPSSLSGGQQQRVAIARALAMKPILMLFDEPTSALDPELVGEVLDVIREVSDSGMTSIIVTHEVGFAREVADDVAFMSGGKVVEFGAPDQVLGAPKDDRTKAFLQRVLS